MTGTPISNFLICSKASLSLVPHFLDLPVHVRSHKGLDIVENPRREFGTELGISREASYFRLILGFGASTIASILLLEICSPSPVSTSPMYSKFLAPMTHFSQLWVSPCSSNLRITLSRFHHVPYGHGQLLSHCHAGCKCRGNPSAFAI